MSKTGFTVGKNSFQEIEFVPTGKKLCGFHWKNKEAMVDYFVLNDSLPKVFFVCKVTVIKQGNELTPRLAFSIRNRENPKNIESTPIPKTDETKDVRASVDLSECHENFWDLVSYLKSLKELKVPDKFFAVDVRNELNRVATGYESLGDSEKRELEKALSDEPDLGKAITSLAESKYRHERLQEFEEAMNREEPEPWWKEFFDKNKWTFGYGLDFRISKMEASQGHVRGADLTGTGEQIIDYAFSTEGDARFMVFLEIKTPMANLVTKHKIRNGAWQIAQDLTDALSQTLSDVECWLDRSRQPEIVKDLAEKDIFSVKPKAFIVIGHLKQLSDAERKIREAKTRTFELFRQSLHGVEVITYDELLARARYIAEHVHPASRENTRTRLRRAPGRI